MVVGLVEHTLLLCCFNLTQSLIIRYPDKNIAARKVICDWIKGNRPIWERWVPDTLLNIGCRKKSADSLCSGHGSCIVPVAPGAGGSNIIGSCKCKMGYAGNMCQRDGKRIVWRNVYPIDLRYRLLVT